MAQPGPLGLPGGFSPCVNTIRISRFGCLRKLNANVGERIKKQARLAAALFFM
jgi:hypothetical protein